MRLLSKVCILYKHKKKAFPLVLTVSIYRINVRLVVVIFNSFCESLYHMYLFILVLLSNDIELKPELINPFLLHTLRNKIPYVKENLLDFDVICFTEAHLYILLNLNVLKKDNTAHSWDLLTYESFHLRPKRLIELEYFCQNFIGRN